MEVYYQKLMDAIVVQVSDEKVSDEEINEVFITDGVSMIISKDYKPIAYYVYSASKKWHGAALEGEITDFMIMFGVHDELEIRLTSNGIGYWWIKTNIELKENKGSE